MGKLMLGPEKGQTKGHPASAAELGLGPRGPRPRPSAPPSPRGALPFSPQGCAPLGVNRVPPLDVGWHPVTTSLCTRKITRQHGARHGRASGPNRPRKAGDTPAPPSQRFPWGQMCQGHARPALDKETLRRPGHRPGLGSVGRRSA